MGRNATLTAFHHFPCLVQGPFSHSASLHITACLLKGDSKRRIKAPSAPGSRKLVKSLLDISPSGNFEVGRNRGQRRNQKQRQSVSASSSRRQSQSQPLRYAPLDLDQQPVPANPWQELTKPQSPENFEREAAPHEGKKPTEQLRSEPPLPLTRSNRSPRKFPPSDRVPWNSRLAAQTQASLPRERTQPKISSSLLSEPTTNRMRMRGGAIASNNTAPQKGRRPFENNNKSSVPSALEEDFDQSDSSTAPITDLPEKFSSPPLLFGLLQSIYETLGPNVSPSPIQALSLKHLFTHPPHIPTKNHPVSEHFSSSPSNYPWSQYLLASETGSGKSIAYLLPMLQYLKLTEHNTAPLPSDPLLPERPVHLRPRGLILAPTHELARQLSTFAKKLVHNVKLRVQCSSQTNNASSAHGTNYSGTASQLKRALEANNERDVEKILNEDSAAFSSVDAGGAEELIIEKPLHTHPVDVLVGTPSHLLEMVRGQGWDLKDRIQEDWDEARKQRARDWIPGPPKLSLRNVEWVVVDEADVLFHTEFEHITRSLLSDISQARGYTHPSFSDLKTVLPPSLSVSTQKPIINAISYPFHLIFTSATIPLSLGAYLTQTHPKLTRLASPHLHQLPKALNVEYCEYASGNKNVEVDKRIKSIWGKERNAKLKSKILIFCNKNSKVEELRDDLEERGVKCLALTGTSATRAYNSNRHLAGFLKMNDGKEKGSATGNSSGTAKPRGEPDQYPLDPKILITTSLLSRGIDFSPSIKYVFILDEPRNMIDFLHRAGRTGRLGAGNEGKVVIFKKGSGRGSESGRELMKKVEAVM